MVARLRALAAPRSDRAPLSPSTVVLVVVVAALGALLSPVLVIAAVLAGAVGLAILDRPERGGLLVVALVPITSGFRPGLGVPGLRLAEVIVLGVAVLVLLAQGSLAGRPGSVDTILLIFVVLHVVLGGLHLAMRDVGGHLDVVGVILGPVQWLLIVRVVSRTLTTTALRRRAIELLLALSVPVSILACLQQLDAGPARQIVTSLTERNVFDTWMYQHFPRATGPFPSWHTLAGYLVVVLVVGLVGLINGSLGVSRRLTITALVAGAAALVLSQTFTSLFAVGAAAAYLAWRRRRPTTAWWLVVGGMALVSGVGGSLSSRIEQQAQNGPTDSIVPQTIAYRFEVWTQEYAPLLARYWSIGYGPGLPDTVDWQHTESGFVTLLLRGGVPLLATGIVLNVALYRTARRGRDRPPSARSGHPADGPDDSGVDRGVCVAVLVLTVAQVPLNLVWPYFTNSGMAQPFWVLVGLLLAAVPADVDRTVRGDARADPEAIGSRVEV